MRALFFLLFIFPLLALSAPISIQDQVEVTATTTSTLAVSADKFRNYLLIQNKGSVGVYVKFGSASTGTEGVYIIAGGNYEPFQSPTSAVYVKSASSTSDLTIITGR
jgi:hypothetical protein